MLVPEPDSARTGTSGLFASAMGSQSGPILDFKPDLVMTGKYAFGPYVSLMHVQATIGAMTGSSKYTAAFRGFGVIGLIGGRVLDDRAMHQAGRVCKPSRP